MTTPTIPEFRMGNVGYNTSPICMASRATIMTGMLEYITGCNFSHDTLTKEKFSKSYPELLQAAGYRTGFAGKFGVNFISKAEAFFPT